MRVRRSESLPKKFISDRRQMTTLVTMNTEGAEVGGWVLVIRRK